MIVQPVVEPMDRFTALHRGLPPPQPRPQAGRGQLRGAERARALQRGQPPVPLRAGGRAADPPAEAGLLARPREARRGLLRHLQL